MPIAIDWRSRVKRASESAERGSEVPASDTVAESVGAEPFGSFLEIVEAPIAFAAEHQFADGLVAIP